MSILNSPGGAAVNILRDSLTFLDHGSYRLSLYTRNEVIGSKLTFEEGGSVHQIVMPAGGPMNPPNVINLDPLPKKFTQRAAVTITKEATPNAGTSA